ncbi:MAG TPA: histidine--tRNA ligase [Candidatus Cloacimonas acidaminovorans]|nr:histidine--tRNA ligase [Candidatus Cloacimonas acidaminovorans]HOS07251.1 histidine--tRNA ligase [Candidatus Cloacimonas acidaminovorans]HQF35742.1 histidine--tRNA ligase [Candidatus Cloacimonas acidaminovorans]
MKYNIPRGTFDILPEDSYKWQFLQDSFRKMATCFGYEEITTPIFEVAELFERSSGESSDVVQKEMYRFQDKKGREFALRPEGTAPVVRSYVENHLDKLSSRTKLFYLGPMFRYDRPQAGRYRQFYQYGIEFIGSNNPYYDAEVIAVAFLWLNKLGLNNLRLEINSVGCPDCSAVYDKALLEYYRPFLPKLCPDCVKRLETNPRRLLDCKVPSCIEFRRNAPSQMDYLDESCKKHFSAVCDYLQAMNIPYTINPRIVRGLDYYTNTAFEIIYEGLGAQNSLVGGGRYNGLIAQIGGKTIPAIGFAGGFERLLLALEEEKIELITPSKPDAYLVCVGDNTRLHILPYLNALRTKGLIVDYDPDKSSLKAQLKSADTSGAKYAIIIGENELATNTVNLKNLQTGEQIAIPMDEEYTINKMKN